MSDEGFQRDSELFFVFVKAINVENAKPNLMALITQITSLRIQRAAAP